MCLCACKHRYRYGKIDKPSLNRSVEQELATLYRRLLKEYTLQKTIHGSIKSHILYNWIQNHTQNKAANSVDLQSVRSLYFCLCSLQHLTVCGDDGWSLDLDQGISQFLSLSSYLIDIQLLLASTMRSVHRCTISDLPLNWNSGGFTRKQMMTESPGSWEVKKTESPNGTLPILVENGSIGGGAELWKLLWTMCLQPILRICLTVLAEKRELLKVIWFCFYSSLQKGADSSRAGLLFSHTSHGDAGLGKPFFSSSI